VVWSARRISRPYSRLSRPEPLLFFPSSSSVVPTRLSGPRSRTTHYLSENLVARGIEAGPLDLQPAILTRDDQRRGTCPASTVGPASYALVIEFITAIAGASLLQSNGKGPSRG
jgi:hypothetical protein